ncbi:MAG: pseudouridine synthase [bacterium]
MRNQTSETMRLNKYLSTQGIGSRRYCESLIQKGEVLVNGEVAHVGMKIDPERDRIHLVHGDTISHHLPRNRYLALYKPRGFLTTMADPLGRPTILKLLPPLKERIYPIGRLDFHSEGLILITNDGDLAFRLSHPGSMIPKTYLVKVKGKPSSRCLDQLKRGIRLSDGVSSFDSIMEIKSRTRTNTWLKVTIHIGKNRIIRRMFLAVGHAVISLTRVSIAGITLEGLAPGEWRYLTRKEMEVLKGL